MGKRKNAIQVHRILICFFAVISLSGCVDQEELKSLRIELIKTQAYNKSIGLELNKLKEKDDSEYRRLMVSAEYFSQEAAIAQACKQPFNINTCPKALTAPGEEAIKNHYSGGQTYVFWSVYIAKLFLLMIVFLAPLVFLVDWWSRRIKPNLEAFSKMEKATLAGEAQILEHQSTAALKYQELTSRHNELTLSVRSLKKEINALQEFNSTLRKEHVDLSQKNKSIADDNERLQAFKF